MENQNEIGKVVEQGSKKGLKKLAIIAAGVVAGVGAIILIKKHKANKLNDSEYDYSEEDSNESEEN